MQICHVTAKIYFRHLALSVYTMLSVNSKIPINRQIFSEAKRFTNYKRAHSYMVTNTFEMNFDGYSELDVEHMFASDLSKEEKPCEELKCKNDPGMSMLCGQRNFRGRKFYENKTLCGIAEFENVDTDFFRMMEAKKLVLVQFTEKAISIYSSKLGELLSKQETEMNELTKNFVNNVKSEVEKWKKCVNYVRQEEEKLMKFLKYLKKLYNSPQFQNRRMRKLADMHTDFFQKYEELVMKHNSEVKSLKALINEEVNKVKRNLSQEFGRKESALRKNIV